MAYRPRSHSTGDVAATFVTSIFQEAGWTCDPVRSDYGEDLTVRIFDAEEATAKFLFVQSKGTEGPIEWDSYGCYRLPLGRNAIELWRSFRVPVIITLFDRTNREAYWQCAQEYFGQLPINIGNNASSILMSNTGKLSSQSLNLLHSLASDYFAAGDQGYIKWIQNKLKDKYGLDVDLGEGQASFWPSGKFVADDDLVEAVFSGKLARMFDALAEETGEDPSELFSKIIRDPSESDRPGPKSRKFKVRGETFSNWRTYTEIQSARSLHGPWVR